MNTWIEAFGILVKCFEVFRHIQILKRIPASFDSIGIARDDRFIGFAVPPVTHADDSIWKEKEMHKSQVSKLFTWKYTDASVSLP